MDPAVPLVMPEINARRIADHKGIIANPNCAAITTLVPLWPVHQVNPVRRLIVSTYQAASGGGAALMEELELSTRAYLDGKDYRAQGGEVSLCLQSLQPQHRHRHGHRL